MRARLLALSGALLLAAGATLASAASTGEAELLRLARDLAQHLRTDLGRDARWGILVVSLDRGDTLFALEPAAPLAPASNVKLLTSAAALHSLGPEFRFRTYLVTDATVREGRVAGDLILFGTGDPGIGDRLHPAKTTVWESLADQLLAAGVHTVEGDLVGDESYFPGPLWPTSWDRDDLNDHFAAGISALSFNENVVSFRVVAGASPGAPPEVHTIPDHAGLQILNAARTVEGRPRQRLAILRETPEEPVRVEGELRSSSRDVWRQMTVPDPALFAVSVFRSVLEERGIRVLGAVRTERARARSRVAAAGVAAPGLRDETGVRVLAVHRSPPLRTYLDVVNKNSNNLFAESLFRTVGRVRDGDASPHASGRAVSAALHELGVDTAGVVLLDGSGLSAGNRVAPATFVELFRALDASAHGPELVRSLPRAGDRRELGRMYRTPAAGNLRAKTGTIERVSALSGVVQSRDGERLAFSMMVNDTRSPYRAKRVENEIGVSLASFTRGADAARSSRVAQLPPPPVPVDSGGPTRHRVRSGETFTTIARRYGLTVDELLRANPRAEPTRLLAGSWIVVPPRDRRPDDPQPVRP